MRLYLFRCCASMMGVVGVALCQFIPMPPTPSDVARLDFTKYGPNDEQRLLRYLLRYYDPSIRPVLKASDALTVGVGMTLSHIFNVAWYDERINWSTNQMEFANISTLTIPTYLVWTPDIVLFNNAEDYHAMKQTNVAIYPNGSMEGYSIVVLWAPPVKTHSTCKLDLTYFPFDDQICYLNFSSWIYDSRQVNVTMSRDFIAVDSGSFTENGEWAIVETRVSTYERRYPHMIFPGVTFTLHLRRRPLFYVYNIIIPCGILSVLTWGQFWLPCESGEKITMGLTVLLAYSVFSFNIAENMPETSEVIPLVAIYLMCLLGISGSAVCLSVIVLNMRHGGDRKKAVPVWLQYLAYRLIGPLVCWAGDDDRHIHRKHSDISFQQAFQSLAQQLQSHQQQHGNVMNQFSEFHKRLATFGQNAKMSIEAESRSSNSSIKRRSNSKEVSSTIRSRSCSTPPSLMEMATMTNRAVSDKKTSIDDCRPNMEASASASAVADVNDSITSSTNDDTVVVTLGSSCFGPISTAATAEVECDGSVALLLSPPVGDRIGNGRINNEIKKVEMSSDTERGEMSPLVSVGGAAGIDSGRRVSFHPRHSGVEQPNAVARADPAAGRESLAREHRRRQSSLIGDNIMKRAARLMDRIEKEQKCDEALHEWRKVSRVFDHFFLLLTCIATIFCTVVLFIGAPRFSRRSLPTVHFEPIGNVNNAS